MKSVHEEETQTVTVTLTTKRRSDAGTNSGARAPYLYAGAGMLVRTRMRPPSLNLAFSSACVCCVSHHGKPPPHVHGAVWPVAEVTAVPRLTGLCALRLPCAPIQVATHNTKNDLWVR